MKSLLVLRKKSIAPRTLLGTNGISIMG